MKEIMMMRQPIYDRRERAVGYDIRLRPLTDGGDALAELLLSGSLDVVAGGLPVWLSVHESHIATQMLAVPGKLQIVALVPAAMEPTPELLQGLNAMQKAGVVIAIDEFHAPSGPHDPLHQLMTRAQYVRIDSRSVSASALRVAAGVAKRSNLQVVADLVFDRAAYTACQQAGADLFLGSYFVHQEPLPASALPPTTATAMRVLSLARDEAVQEKELERALASDPTLTYQLLRIVNSASSGGRGITSVGHALRLAGRNTLIRWLSLAAFASKGTQSGVDAELTAQAVRRAYVAEGLAKLSGKVDAQTAFLVGLFSLIDAVFRIPMADVVERIHLASDVCDALLDHAGPYAEILQFIEAYDLAQWELAISIAKELGVDPGDVGELYLSALADSSAMLKASV